MVVLRPTGNIGKADRLELRVGHPKRVDIARRH